MQDAVVELVEQTLADNPAIDRDRVYLTGLSMGSYGSWGLLPEHRDLFAGAVLVCGAGADEAAVATSLGDFPIWAVHSADDSVVAYDQPGSDYRMFRALEAAGHPVTWSEWAGTAPEATQEAQAASAWNRASAAGSSHIFTTFPAGTTPLFDHGSWIPTYTNDTIIDWLFAQ
jgi:predicted peptidase